MKTRIPFFLLLAFSAPIAFANAQPTKLELPHDATRDQVKAILREQGLSDSDKQVDDVMEKLKAAKNRKNGLHEYVKENLPGMDLVYKPMYNQHQASGKLNGKPVTFIIDSGAHASLISTDTCKRIGLKTVEIGKGRGIGGDETAFMTEYESMTIGEHLKFPAQKVRASDMNQTKEAGNVSDGLIGADVLTKIGAIIDFRTHRLAYYNAKDKVDISPIAKSSGFQEIQLKNVHGHSVLETTIKGQPARFIIDTGAQQSLLDTAFATRLGLPLIPTAMLIQGIGSERKSAEITSIDEIELGGSSKLKHSPMLVMPLDHVQSDETARFDGILGAEFLFATGAVYDAGNQKLYIEPGMIDVRSHTKTGAEMFSGDEELKSTYANATRVLAGTVTEYGVMDLTTKDANGNVWRAIQVKANFKEVFKGDASEVGAEENVLVLVKDEPNLDQTLSGLFARNPQKLFFLGEKSDGKTGNATTVDSVIWTDGELPRNQLKRLGLTK